jgi:hypothetical protein
MTIDTPLTCYICGETKDDMTVDLLGCIKNMQEADKRFIQKFGKSADGFLYVCLECRNKDKFHTKKVYEKYGIYGEEICN